MRNLNFSDLEKETLLFGDFVGIRQSWKTRAGYSYLNKGRPDSGLTLILCGRAVYTLSDGRKLHAAAGDLLLLPQGSHYLARFEEPRPEGQPDTLLFNFRLRYPAGEAVTPGKDPIRLLHDADSTAYQHMSVAIDAIAKGKNFAATRRLMQLLELASEENSHREKDPFTAVTDYIENHLGADISVPDLPPLCHEPGDPAAIVCDQSGRAARRLHPAAENCPRQADACLRRAVRRKHL